MIGKMVLGGVVGGLAGLATSDSNTSTGKFQDALKGAAIGVGAGVGVSAALSPRFWKGAGKMAGKVAWGGIKRAPGFIGKGVSASFGIGSWALRHPRSTVAMGVAGLGAASLASNTRPMGLDTMSALAERSGGPSTGFMPGMGASRQQESRAMFLDSTNGLVQGLHAGRHRG